MTRSYSESFFLDRSTITLSSTQAVLGLLWDGLQPESVLDVGCGTGTWLAECKRRGATRVLGVDGPWVPSRHLEVGGDEFLAHDLSESMPADLGEFDVALCIEVAEHLPPRRGDELVRLLASRAGVVVFSAAVEGQGGTGHVNEQPQSYWFERFRELGFDALDLVRPGIWDRPDVNVIYRQNLLVYARPGTRLHQESRRGPNAVRPLSSHYELDRIHPELFLLRTERARSGLVGLFRRWRRLLSRNR